MIDRFGEAAILALTDRDRSGAIDDQVLNQALADADAKIDSYLGAVVTLPLEAVPEVLIPVACDIARYQLFGTKATEEARLRYKEALDWLKDVARGVASLGLDGEGEATPQADQVKFSAPDRVFSEELLADF